MINKKVAQEEQLNIHIHVFKGTIVPTTTSWKSGVSPCMFVQFVSSVKLSF